MKFGPVPVAEAEGCLLAHSLRLDDRVLKKGYRLQATDLAALAAGGIAQVVVARLEADDVHEDAAARRLGEALAGFQVDRGNATTGRMNLCARRAGLVRIDAARIHAVNAVHESLTVATLPDAEPVAEGQMLATVKVIPYSAPAASLEHTIALAAGPVAAIDVAPWIGLGVGLVLTCLPETRGSVLAKMRAAVEKRLGPLDGRLIAEEVVAHETAAVGAAIERLAAREGIGAVLVSGIAATIDRADVVPAGISVEVGIGAEITCTGSSEIHIAE